MACHLRERTGSCSHTQCRFSTETVHGYECIEIVTHKGRGFCEVGLNCLGKCPYSYTNQEEKLADEAFDSAYPLGEENPVAYTVSGTQANGADVDIVVYKDGTTDLD